jgi:CRISPR system Cascade subunit CasE
MYLSRLTLNPRSRQAGNDMANCQELHRRLLSAFGPAAAADPGARAQLGLLYRVDESSTRPAQVLVQSRELPNWAALPDGYLFGSGGELENPACKPVNDFYAELRQGMALRFRLRANPTRRIAGKSEAEKPEKRGKRVELRGEEQWHAWLARKGDQHGFEPRRNWLGAVDVQMIDQGKLQGWRGREVGTRRMTLAAVLFNGRLEVTEVELFRQALVNGIGSGKAYGFGLLSVARES